MNTEELDILQKLNKSDQEKIRYFLKLLLNQSKYKQLKQEIDARRDEIRKGDFLTHDEIWHQLDV